MVQVVVPQIKYSVLHTRMSESSASSMSSEKLAKDCKAFYEKRLRLTHSVEHKWNLEAGCSAGDLSSSSSSGHFSKLPTQIAQLRSELLSLAHLDNELFKNLLALNDKLEELKLQRDQGNSSTTSNDDDEAVTENNTTEEYDDDDIDEEVDDEDEYNVYSSLPPAQILERAAVMAHTSSKSGDTSGSGCSQTDANRSENNGLDVMGGLKFMLRSRSFLLRPPFHKKNTVTLSRTTPRRSRITSSDSPFRTFDRIQENRVVTDEDSTTLPRSIRSQSAERRQQRKKRNSAADFSKLEAGSSATLTRGFHLPNSSKSLWQRVFVGGGSQGQHAASASAPGSHQSHSFHNNNGPESLPCSWSIIDDKSPPPTLKHIKQNSFDSGIHTSDSSEYSIKV